MKGTRTILFAAVVCLSILAGCSTQTYPTPEPDAALEAQYKAKEEASLKYIIENFPTREQTLRVRECITARTGFDEFPEMSDASDYGPHILTPTPGPVPNFPPEVDRAELDCIFDLGLEDRYIPPQDQQALRNANDS